MASPLRICQATGHYMPTGGYRSEADEKRDFFYLTRTCLDLLVRVARLRLAPELRLGDESLLPDGIQHPQFQPRRAGKGHYVICNKRLATFESESHSPLRLYAKQRFTRV
jgi:hypothetical protein